jgi:hypothetical protein
MSLGLNFSLVILQIRTQQQKLDYLSSIFAIQWITLQLQITFRYHFLSFRDVILSFRGAHIFAFDQLEAFVFSCFYEFEGLH